MNPPENSTSLANGNGSLSYAQSALIEQNVLNIYRELSKIVVGVKDHKSKADTEKRLLTAANLRHDVLLHLYAGDETGALGAFQTLLTLNADLESEETQAEPFHREAVTEACLHGAAMKARKAAAEKAAKAAAQEAPQSNEEQWSRLDIPDWLFPRKVALLSDYLPPQIMHGLLYQGCRFVFGGSPKAKKSWLLMLCCFCVANGLPFLGIPTTKGKVVYINFELLEGECRRRFHQIQKAMGTGSLDDIEVIQLRDKRLSNENLEQLERIISDVCFVLCSFDPVYKLLDGRDERLGIDIAPVLASLGAISEKSNRSVGFSQHFTKGNQSQKFAIDRISGSNYFTRDADVILVMTNLNEPDCYGIEIIQRSFPEIKPFGIRWRCPIFVRDDSIDAADIQQPGKESKADPIIDRMLAVLHAANFDGGLSFTEFLRAVQVKGPTGTPAPERRLSIVN